MNHVGFMTNDYNGRRISMFGSTVATTGRICRTGGTSGARAVGLASALGVVRGGADTCVRVFDVVFVVVIVRIVRPCSIHHHHVVV